MNYRIRHSTIADAESLAHVHSVAWQETYRGILPDDMLALTGSFEKRTAIRREVFASTSPHHAHFIVENEVGEVVGFSDCGPARDVGHVAPGEIIMIYLLRKAQGQGLGRELMQRMLHHLTEQKFAQAALLVLSANADSRHFYEKCGGELALESRKNIGGIVVPSAIYRWTLS